MGSHTLTSDLTEDRYRRCLEGINYSGLEEPYRHTLQNYVERGLAPGDALRIALEGNIRAILRFHDPLKLYALVRWIHDALPAPAWGSRRKVRQWMKIASKVSSRDDRCNRRPSYNSAFNSAVSGG